VKTLGEIENMRIASFAATLVALMSTAAIAETPNRPQLAAAVKAAHPANLNRLRDWIAHPTIAAEKLNIDGGADISGSCSSTPGSSRRSWFIPTAYRVFSRRSTLAHRPRSASISCTT